MRSLHLVTGISAFSALVVAVGVGCSSSSNKGSPSTGMDGSTVTPGEDGGVEEAAAASCPTDAGNISTWTAPGASEAGTALLDCERAQCASETTACAADSCCNSTFIAAFLCLDLAADGGSSASLPYATEAACFANVSMDTAGSAMISCLIGAEMNCGLGDGGKPDGATTATDGATTATDASGDGAIEQ
jgi:hypothetical protein